MVQGFKLGDTRLGELSLAASVLNVESGHRETPSALGLEVVKLSIEAVEFPKRGEGEPFSVWSYVEDVDRIIEELRLAGVEIVAEPVDQPWGERVAEVRDPTGILVHLANAAS
ncbi:MAG: VOC family protein [Actinobacteria bacterium]|nr:VOC family protein [Actinomycetota bacterium]